jgi:DNA-3-methyladenine glycosylase
MKKFGRSYYQVPAEMLAERLIGTIMVRRIGDRQLPARIVETEAYVGPDDLACHTSRGRTKRTEVMFGPAGHAYVYFIYGMYDMLNIVAGKTGSGQAVLIRAAEPIGWEADLSGPGKLARAMRITRAQNGLDLTTGKELFLHANSIAPMKIARSKRIGVDYAGHWKHRLLRFTDPASKSLSRP